MIPSFLSLNKIIPLVGIAQSNPWISIAFYLVYVVGVMALPITLFPIIGGVLFPFWIAYPLNVLAATAGGWLSFLLARILGRKRIEPLLRKNLKSLDGLMAAEGFKAVLVLRLIGVPPFIVSNYALGFSNVNSADFWTGTMIGILPWMGVVTYLANSLWHAVQVGGERGLVKALAEALGPFMIISAATVLFVLINFVLKKRRTHSNL